MMQYDIIGDVHGHALELEMLLQKMGYRRMAGVYRHPKGRKVIFAGDLIDRGPRIRETLHLAKDMCDAGQALIVMGNHEFNAISFHTPHTETGGFFRDHDVEKIEQHLETLRQFRQFPGEWQYFLEWFKTIPLFLELENLRVVHACWDDEHIALLHKKYKGMTAEFLKAANDKWDDTGIYNAIEETLKGKEYRLPDGLSFADRHDIVRHHCRTKWWAIADKDATYGTLLFNCPDEIRHKPADPSLLQHSYKSNLPVFFGHYWLTGKPVIENPKAICLDYSVAKHGNLVAARIDLEGAENPIVLTYV